MMRLSRSALALALILLPAACDSGPAAPAPDADLVEHSAHARPAGAGDAAIVNRWLARLRAALAPYHDIEAAQAALWPDPITGCMEQPGTGGMGFHYGDLARFDAVVDPVAPELLLYEPQKNGRMRLVGVEWAIPFTEWTSPVPPELNGVPFHRNEGFGLWVLHAWVGRHNPAGMFMDWNPVVTCKYAP